MNDEEEELRKQLRSAMQSLNRREPLEATFERLLMNANLSSRRPVLIKDKFYKRVGSNLRQRVEEFTEQTAGKDPWDRILRNRQPLEEAAMRAALTLREPKKFEQQALLESTVASFPRRRGMDESAWRKHLQAIAMGLQARDKSSGRSSSGSIKQGKQATAVEQTEHARQQEQLLRQKEIAKAREDERRKRQEDEQRRRDAEVDRKRKAVSETPQQALYKIYRPIFEKLWGMEFPALGGTNPFRLVIDKHTCASLGAPDYFDVIEKPMNLTYIQQKVERMEYEALKDFFDDVELMISNAILYNSDPSNQYRIAAEDMKKRYVKIARKVLQTIQSRQQQRK